jgi:hypothetical protein
LEHLPVGADQGACAFVLEKNSIYLPMGKSFKDSAPGEDLLDIP